MVQQSKFNNTYTPLGIDGFFEGQLESTDGLVAISVNCLCDQPYQVIIRQYRANDRTTILQENSENVAANVKSIVQTPIKAQFFNVVVLNQSGGTAMEVTQITTILNSTHFINLDIRKLEADGGKEDSVLCYGVDTTTGIKHPLNVDASGSLIVIGGGGGDASLWSEFPALQDVDMNDKGLTNVNGIGGAATKGLPIVADGQLGLSSNSAVVVSSKTEVILVIPPESSPTPLPTKTLTYDVNGDLTFAEGTQNLSNELGTTTSKNFTLTAGGAGKIVFSDLTEMTTASTGGDTSQWATFPAVADVDMDSHKIINITELGSSPNQPLFLNNDITFNTNAGNYINNVSDIVGSNVGGNDPYLQIQNLTSIITPGELQVNVTGGVGFYNGTNLNLHGGIISDIGDLRFSDLSIQTTAYQNPFQTQLDLNGNSVIGTQQIFGNNDMIFTAGLTNTSESSTLSLTNNGYAVAGTYSQLFLKPTGVELNTGDITSATDYKATLDTAGVFTVPKLNISGTSDGITFANADNYIYGDGLNIATPTNTAISLFTNNNAVTGDPTSRMLMNNTGIRLTTGLIDSDEHIALFDSAGLFTAPQFKVAQEIIGYGLDMSKAGIINAQTILSAPATNINIDGYDAECQVVISANTSGIGGTSSLSVSPAGIVLNTLITGTEDTASATFLPQFGKFTAPFFSAQGFQPTVGVFQKGYVDTAKVTNVERIEFSDLTVQTTAFGNDAVKTITSTDDSVTITTPSPNTVNLSVAIPPSITSNTFYVNDNVNTINDVLPLMGSGDICIVSAGSFGNTVDINWNVAQSGLSGSVAPIPLTFLTTANASRFTVSAVQVRVANIKFQMPVFLSNNNLTVDNCDFDDNLTVGTNVSGYITINNCEFIGTKTVTVANTFGNVCYFINCNFAGSTFVLSQASASQVIFNNCAGFTTYPANATYVGINVSSAGSAQLNTNTMKSVVTGGTIKFLSNIDMDGNSTINCNNIGGRTGDPVTFTNGLELQTGGGAFNMRGNTLFNVGTMTQILSGSSTVTTQGSATASRFLQTVTIPSFTGGASATYVYNDLGTLSLKNVTLTTGGVITYPDATTSNSGLIKGTATLVAGLHTITDARVTTGAICVVSYADSSPVGGVLCAKVTTGQIVIESKLITDTSPVFYMYFI